MSSNWQNYAKRSGKLGVRIFNGTLQIQLYILQCETMIHTGSILQLKVEIPFHFFVLLLGFSKKCLTSDLMCLRFNLRT